MIRPTPRQGYWAVRIVFLVAIAALFAFSNRIAAALGNGTTMVVAVCVIAAIVIAVCGWFVWKHDL
jgi:uncharacterized membrane protein YhaH (DUF805 family)